MRPLAINPLDPGIALLLPRDPRLLLSLGISVFPNYSNLINVLASGFPSVNGTIFISCLLFYGLLFGIPNSFGGSKPRSSSALFAIPNPIPGVGAPLDLRACYLDPSPPRPP